MCAQVRKNDFSILVLSVCGGGGSRMGMFSCMQHDTADSGDKTALKSQFSHFCVVKACSLISLSSASLSVKMEIPILTSKLRSEVYRATHTAYGMATCYYSILPLINQCHKLKRSTFYVKSTPVKKMSKVLMLKVTIRGRDGGESIEQTHLSNHKRV